MAFRLPARILEYMYVLGLVAVAAALPLSLYLMSFAQFWLGGVWLLQGNYASRLKTLASNKAALFMISILLLHLLGLAWTENMDYALSDLRKKLPLFILPFIMGSNEPLKKWQVHVVLGIYLLAVFVGTMASVGNILGLVGAKALDSRNISIFISHIRFSLNICLAIFILAYYAYTVGPRWLKALLILVAAWLLFFLFILKAMSGFLALGLTAFVLILYFIFNHKNKKARYALSGIFIALLLGFAGYVRYLITDYYAVKPVDYSLLEQQTAHGNAYVHDTVDTQTENGNRIWLYVCMPELEQEWSRRSKISLDSIIRTKSELKYTLMRFMASKGLRKDAEGIKALSNDEVQAIEKGIANVDHMKSFSIKPRIEQTIWELDYYFRGGDPNSHSMSQRFEYWKTALHLIKKHWALGVGTGDVQDAFVIQYEQDVSRLNPNLRKRSHNQFLTMAVTFGLLGLAWFLFALLHAAFMEVRARNYFYATFFVIALSSMLTEDTLETQAGVTFFVFFSCLFLSRNQLP